MNARTPLPAFFLALLGVLLVSPAAAAAPRWLTSWPQALEQARALDRPVVVAFTGSDWSEFCQRLDREVFQDEAFAGWASKSAVLLRIDFPRNGGQQSPELQAQNERLKQRFKVRGFPTLLFVDAKGKLMFVSGYATGSGAGRWLLETQQRLKQAERVRALLAKNERSAEQDVELFLLEDKLGRVDLTVSLARLKKAELDPAQRRRLDPILATYEVQAVIAQAERQWTKTGVRPDPVEVGLQLVGLYRAKRWPHAPEEYAVLAIHMLDVAEHQGDAVMFAACLERLGNLYGKLGRLQTPPIRRYLEEQATRLERLGAGDEPGAEQPEKPASRPQIDQKPGD